MIGATSFWCQRPQEVRSEFGVWPQVQRGPTATKHWPPRAPARVLLFSQKRWKLVLCAAPKGFPWDKQQQSRDAVASRFQPGMAVTGPLEWPLPSHRLQQGGVTWASCSTKQAGPPPPPPHGGGATAAQTVAADPGSPAHLGTQEEDPCPCRKCLFLLPGFSLLLAPMLILEQSQG